MRPVDRAIVTGSWHTFVHAVGATVLPWTEPVWWMPSLVFGTAAATSLAIELWDYLLPPTPDPFWSDDEPPRRDR